MEKFLSKAYDDNMKILLDLNFFWIIYDKARQYLNYHEYNYLKLPIFKSMIYTYTNGNKFKSRDMNYEYNDIPNLGNEENYYFVKVRKIFESRIIIYFYERPIILFVILIILIILIYTLFKIK
jgi:hypothetical protein